MPIKVQTQAISLIRHAWAETDAAQALADSDDYALGISVPGPDKAVPVIKGELIEIERLAGKLYGNFSGLYQLPVNIYSSTYRRAIETAAAFRAFLLKMDRTLCISNINSQAEIDGRHYGFTWSRTLLGIAAQFSDEYERLLDTGTFQYRPPGGENWPDVIERLTRFKNEVIDHSRNHMVFVIHAELFPILEALLQGNEPGEETVLHAGQRINNATAVTYVRDHNYYKALGPWKAIGMDTGAQRRNDYRRILKTYGDFSPTTPGDVVYLKEVSRR